MSRIVISLDQDCTRKELEAVVDEELRLWDREFQQASGNLPLTPSEKAILKTYLGMKLLPKLKEEELEAPLPPV